MSRTSRTILAQSAPAHGTRAEIQNIQRLLKLLADRYPQTYGSVDPGKVDGRLRTDTRKAIENFRTITGSHPEKQSSEELAAEILAALAQISATKTAEVKSDVPRAAPAPQPAAPTAEPPAAPAVPRVTPPPATAKTRTAPAPAPKPTTSSPPAETIRQASAAKPAAQDGLPPLRPLVVARDGTPGKDGVRRLYFVQAASLQSLEAAKKEWRRIFEENRAALRGEQVYFERADIANRGTFFRILIGPMAERGAAKTLCGFLKQNDQSCVVTSRKVADLPASGDSEKDAAPAPKQDSDGGTDTSNPPETRQAAAPAAAPKPAEPNSPTAAQEAPAVAVTPPAESTQDESARDESSRDTSRSSEQSAPDEQAPEPATSVATATQVPPAPTPAPSDAKSKPNPEPAIAPESEKQSGTKDTAAVAPATAVPSPMPSPPPVPTTPKAPKAPESATSSTAPAPATPAPADHAGQQAKPAAAAPQPPQSDLGDYQAKIAAEVPQTTPATAPSGAAPAERPMQTSPIAAVSRLLDAAGNTTQAMGIAAVLVVGAGLLLLIWRRQTRRTSFAQMFQGSSLSLARNPANTDDPEDTLQALETDFDSEALRQSRSVRDAFLMDILGDQVNEEVTRPKEDSAIRINSSLKSLLVSDPAQYKSIFLNWIFLAKVGTALNDREIAMEQLNGKFSRELDLLQNYFKIHLLELDDRHRIRKQLPGLFYCLQVAQERRRKASAHFSAA